MVDQSKIGTDWQDDELDAIVADYFAMLAAEQAGEAYVKAHQAKALSALTGRPQKSVEFKLMNLSYALSELGLPIIRGYRPMQNIQRAIFPAIDRYLSQHPEAWSIGDAPLLPIAQRWGGGPRSGGGAAGDIAGVAETSTDFVLSFTDQNSTRLIRLTDAPALGEAQPRPEGLKRLVRKFDPAARDARNRALGRVGEQTIYEHEIARLIEADRMKLAQKVEWTSEERGDGAGYDIRSFDPASGQERFIEVKTTRGGARTDFFLSRNEHAFSDEEPERFRLYRLYDAAAEMKLFVLPPPLEAMVTLEAETWRAGFGDYTRSL
ncbi:DUF3883 domain-containing protein [Brevundimonas sp.]|uniref:DUF3883 domain-containing protein n=1 Tax=Brevundimonas sp. TaxID=1871086 RepID=UPI0035B1D364